MFFATLFIGCIFGCVISKMIISACLPSASTSQSCSPMAPAPPTVAISNTSNASNADASPNTTFCNAVVKNISRNISKQLLLAGPSVPIARPIPISFILWIGAMPLASFRFDAGFVTTHTCLSLQICKSSSVICTQ